MAGNPHHPAMAPCKVIQTPVTLCQQWRKKRGGEQQKKQTQTNQKFFRNLPHSATPKHTAMTYSTNAPTSKNCSKAKLIRKLPALRTKLFSNTKQKGTLNTRRTIFKRNGCSQQLDRSIRLFFNRCCCCVFLCSFFFSLLSWS